jgi:UDP-glucose 4-epimerase
MKILITGSSGFVGMHLAKKLSTKHEVVGYDLKSGQDVLNERLLLKKLSDVDLVIHLAAFISTKESWKKPKKYFVNNSLGTLSVIKNSIHAGVKKVIFFSSAAVKTEPFTPYSVSKRSAEEIINLYSNDIESIIIRPENIYGTGQKKEYGYVIHNFIKAIKEGKPVTIYGNGLQTRDFIYIDDVVDPVSELVNKGILGGPLSLGTGHPVKIKDLALFIGKLLKMPVKINYEAARIEPKSSFADTSTLAKVGINSSKFLSLQKGIIKLMSQLP